MSTYIPVTRAAGTNFSAPNPPKEITAKNGEKYTRTYMTYNYGTVDRPYMAEALFELQICKGKVKKNKKGEYKLNLIIEKQEDQAGLTQVSLGFAICVDKYKNKFGLRNFSPQATGDLRGAFFYPATEDGEIIAGANPIVSLKINDKSKFKMLKPKINPETNEPIYIDGIPDFEEELLDYKTLLDKQLDCSVVINPRDLYRSSGMPLPQIFTRSCMILNMSESGDVEHAKSDMVRSFLQQNPEVLNNLAEQIAKLKTGGATVSLLQTVDTSKTETPPAQTLPQQQSPTASSPSPITVTPIQIPITSSFPGIPQVTASPAPVSLGGGQLQFNLPMNMGLSQAGGLPQGGIDLTAFLSGQQNVPSVPLGNAVNIQKL